jgi:hypothetical protein
MTTPASTPSPDPPPATPTAPTADAAVPAGNAGAPPAGAGPEAPPQTPSPTTELSGQATETGPGTPEAPQAESSSIESGEDAADATEHPGEGTERRRALNQADRNINGDFILRDKIVIVHGGAGGTVRLHSMPPSLLESAQSAFVAPPGWGDLLVAHAKSRVLIVRGRVGHGKTTAAIRLLLGRDADPIYHVGSTDLANLAEALQARGPAESGDRAEQGDQGDQGGQGELRGAGFVLDDPAEFAGLRGGVLRGIEAALEGAQAHLVIAADSAEPLRDQAFLDLAAELTGFPDRHQVLLAHLRRFLDEPHAVELLARTEIEELVAAYITDDTPCSGIVNLAVALADDELAGEADVDRVRERLSQRVAADFGAWFAGLPDTEARCHAVALAALGGAASETVTRAARNLHRRLNPETDDTAAPSPEDKPPGRDPFHRTQGELLSLLRARTRTETALGRGPVRTVEYCDPGYPRAVLRHVWTQYAIHDELLAWLEELAVDPSSQQVRVLAGSSLGALALVSFDHLCQRTFKPWASRRMQSQREAVAYALRVAATDRALLPKVRELTSAWYKNRADPAAQATAARVHGLSLGPLDPDAAVAVLLRLMVVDRISVAIAIGKALADLLLVATSELALSVLAGLLAAAQDRSTAPAAELIFLQLTVEIYSEQSTPAPTSAGAPAPIPAPAPVIWPYLLDLAGTAPDARDFIIRLWQSVIDSGRFHSKVEGVLTLWAGMAQADPALRDAYLRLARAVAQNHDRSRRMLRQLATTWVDKDNLAPLTEMSAALRRVLPKD